MEKKKTESIVKLKNKVQIYFNAYIRKRDTILGKEFKCISCGKILPVEKMQCGHYFSVKGNDGLRFDELNANGECQACNGFNKDHQIWYGINLKNKIGEIRYESLISLAKYFKANPKKWTIAELNVLLRKYKL